MSNVNGSENAKSEENILPDGWFEFNTDGSAIRARSIEAVGLTDQGNVMITSSSGEEYISDLPLREVYHAIETHV